MRIFRLFPILLLVALLLASTGCVRRTLRVESEPPGARVFFDGHDKGTTPVEFDFKWYGGHKVMVEKEGYARQSRIVELKAPLTHQVPLDLVTALAPFKSIDRHAVDFTLDTEPMKEQE